MWSYLGGSLNLVFTWSVVPVIEVVIYVETALIWSLLVLGCFSDKVSLFQTVPGGGLCCVFVMTSFWGGGTWGGGFSWCTVMWFACVMVNCVSLPCWDDELFCSVLFWFHSLSDGEQFLCVVGLKGHWVPAKLFLLHNWVIALVLKGLVWFT